MATNPSPDTPAFPLDVEHPGITVRQYFAVMALQGLVAKGGSEGRGYSPELAAQDAVALADALIAALGSKQ